MASSTGIFTPFFALDLRRDASRSTEGEEMQINPLFIGQATSAGTATNGTILEVNSIKDVEVFAGKGSHLYSMMSAYFEKRSSTRSYIGVLDDASGTAAKRTVTIGSVPTKNGTLNYRINGSVFSVPALTTDTVTTIAAKMVALVEDTEAYTASNTAGVVTYTSNNKGLAVGQINIAVMEDPTDQPVEGLVVSVGALTEGTVDPDVQDVLDSIGDSHYYLMVGPYSDTANLSVIETKLNTLGDEYNARDGQYVTTVDGTVSELVTKAKGIASKYISIIDTYGWEDSGAKILGTLGREVSVSVKDDVNLPLHNLVLTNRFGAYQGSERVWEERNALVRDGVATLDPTSICIEGPVTTFTETSEERRWENMFNLAALRISFKNRILKTFARAKLKVGDEPVAPGIPVITIPLAEGVASQWYSEKVYLAQTEDQEYFDTNLVVEVTDVDTLTWSLPVTLVGQYVVGTGTLDYILGGN